ncbi:hypothetical protein [Streptomyces sp. NPDC058228]|uniref:hypothetical protein n=1 Tax=Streptomyces sp. NPDC058228 TaxID=3346390 RepID=UPI0036EEF647
MDSQNTPVQVASADAVAAAQQSEQFAMMLAAVQAAQILQAQQPTPQQPVVQAASSGSAMKWLAIGMGGSALLLAVAVSAVAVAISAVALTICVLILRSVWQDISKGRSS